MPQPFLDCIKNGGHVITKRVNETQYIKVCYKDGKSYSGEVHTYKKLSRKKKNKSKRTLLGFCFSRQSFKEGNNSKTTQTPTPTYLSGIGSFAW